MTGYSVYVHEQCGTEVELIFTLATKNTKHSCKSNQKELIIGPNAPCHILL